MLHRSSRSVHGSPIELPFLHDHDATLETPARTSENPLSTKFHKRPFHALGCIGCRLAGYLRVQPHDGPTTANGAPWPRRAS